MRFRLLPIAAIIVLSGCSLYSGLPTYGTVPEFTLTAENGKPFGSADLDGRVWVADFIFTTCNGPCPRMAAQMKRLQAMLEGSPDVRFVSFTIDPKNDTPEILTAYAKRWKADPIRWRFLTGPANGIRAISLDTFHLSDVGGALEHSARFALVDKKMRIRGYYEASDANGLPDLSADIEKLRKEIM